MHEPTPAESSEPAADAPSTARAQHTGARRRARRTAVVIVSLLGLVGGLLVVSGQDDPDPAPRRAAGRRVAGPASPARIKATVEELQAFVEAERGLAFRHDVKASLATESEIHRLLVDQLEEERTQIEETGTTLRALGMLERDDDLFEMVASFVGLGVLGFYDPVEDRLVVRGQELTPLVKSTIAHELTHALQDQHFDLDRPELDERDDESSLALSALAEGDAGRVEDAYRDSLSAIDQARADADEERLARDAVAALGASEIPEGVLAVMLLAQALGPNVVRGILDRGGSSRLDEAFRSPPTTSEQLIDPDRFLRGEHPATVDLPEADGRVVQHGMLGQSVLQLLLQLSDDGSMIDPARQESATRASRGWGGDRYVTWRARGNACIRVTWVMDTPEDLAELGDALDGWATRRPGTRVERSDATATLTACDAATGDELPRARLARYEPPTAARIDPTRYREPVTTT